MRERDPQEARREPPMQPVSMSPRKVCVVPAAVLANAAPVRGATTSAVQVKAWQVASAVKAFAARFPNPAEARPARMRVGDRELPEQLQASPGQDGGAGWPERLCASGPGP